MKNLMLVLVLLALGCGQLFGQKGQVGPKHSGTPSIDETMEWVDDGSDTAVQFKRNIVINLADLLKDTADFTDSSFSWAMVVQSSYRHVSLKKGTWYNAEWNPATGKIESFLSKVDFEGIVRFFQWGSYSTSLYKEECWNTTFERSLDGVHPFDQPQAGADQNPPNSKNNPTTFTKSSSENIYRDNSGSDQSSNILNTFGGGAYNLYSNISCGYRVKVKVR